MKLAALILALSAAPASAAVLCPPPQITDTTDKPPAEKERCIGNAGKDAPVNIRKRMPVRSLDVRAGNPSR